MRKSISKSLVTGVLVAGAGRAKATGRGGKLQRLSSGLHLVISSGCGVI